MIPPRILSPLLVSAFLAMTAFSVPAQEPGKPIPSGDAALKAKPVSRTDRLPSHSVPAATSVSELSADCARPVSFRGEEQMTAADHTLVAAKGRAIADAASLASIDLLQGSWSLRQIDCPALPGHLFVRYRRDQGPGDVSEFTAAIERSGAGSVHAIPILRRSYTTLFEAPASAVAVFNRVQQEEQSPRQPALLGLAQCYAVLAGSTGQPVTGAAWPQGQPSMMRSVGNKKVVQISVPTESATPAAWELTFGNSGMLEKAVSSSLDLGNARKVPPTGEINSHLVPPAAVLETHPVPQGVAPVTHNVPPGSAPVSHPVPQN